MALALVLAGCPSTRGINDDDDSADDDDAGPDDDDTGSDDDDTGPDDDDTGPSDDDDSAAPLEAFFTGFVFEPESNAGIAGATVTVIQDPQFAEVTDTSGGYGLQVFGFEEVDLRAEAAGFLPSTVAAVADLNIDPSNGILHVMLPPSMPEELAQALGTAADATRGLVLVAAVDPAGEPIDGAQVALDADNAGSLMLGAGQPLPGDTLTAQDTMAIFVNVEAVPTTVTLTTSANLTCVGRNPIDPRPDEIVSVTYICE